MMKFSRILRLFVLALIFVIPFIPLVVTTSLLFPYITGKNFAFRILVELAFGGWAILAITMPSVRPRFTRFAWLLIIFLGVIGIADILSRDPFKSFWSNFERMEGYITLLHLFGYFLVARAMLSGEKLWTRFFQTSIGVSVVVSLHGTLQLMGALPMYQSTNRIEATLGNASYLAAYIMVHIFLTLFLLMREERSRLMRYVYGAVIILEAVILYETATRGAILGAIAGLLAFGIIVSLTRHRMKSLRAVALAGFVALGIGIALIFAFKDTALIRSSTPLKRFSSVSLAEAKPRFLLWNIAWQGFKERPLLGWGQESFNYAFNKYYDPKMYAQEQWFDRTHNVFLDWLIAGGLAGLVSYAALYVYAFFAVWSGVKPSPVLGAIRTSQGKHIRAHHDSIPSFSMLERGALTGLLIAYMVQNLFVFDNLLSYIAFFSIIAYMDMRAASRMPHWQQNPGRSKNFLSHPRIAVFAASCIAVVTMSGIYFLNAPPLRAAAGLTDAIKPYPEGVKKNLEYFKKILAKRSLGTSEIREQLVYATLSAIRAQNVPEELKRDFFMLTIQEFDKQFLTTPNDARQHFLIGTFLSGTGFFKDALAELEKARSLSPTKQRIYFEIAVAYFFIGETDKAEEAARIAYELEPAFTEAYYVYTNFLIRNKKFEMVRALQKERFGSAYYPDGRLIQAYREIGAFDEALEQWKELVRLYPDITEYNLGLAIAYFEATKDPQRAYDVLMRTAEQYPALRERAEYCVKEIAAGRRPQDTCLPKE